MKKRPAINNVYAFDYNCFTSPVRPKRIGPKASVTVAMALDAEKVFQVKDVWYDII